MAQLPPGAREFLKQGALAHIVTLEPDGSPHVSLAWAGADGDEIVWSTFFDQHKLDNLRRDPRIALSFEAHGSGGERLHPYLVINGRARVNNANSCAGDSAAAEGGAVGFYGGDDDTDNSGVLRYVRVEYAGKEITPNNELNSFTNNAVGSGTRLEFLQAHRGADDGFHAPGPYG